MKKVIEFLKSYPSIYEGAIALEQELGIKHRDYPDEGLVVFNYDQIESPKTHPIVMECRGLILDEQLNVVCQPFDRFFNYGEAPEVTGQFNPENCVAYEKADGSLVKMYYWGGLWRVATRGTAFAETTTHDDSITFQDLILRCAGVESIEELTEKLEPFIAKPTTFIFEVISPMNRIVTPYDKEELVLLGYRDNETGEDGFNSETDVVKIFRGCGLNVRAPRKYDLSNIEQIKEFVEGLNGLEEGVVCVDKDTGVRVKIKSSAYVAAHRLRGEGTLTKKNIAGMVVTGEVEEYLTYFESDRKFFTPYIEAMERMLDEIENVYKSVSTTEDQKEFAMSIKDHTYAFLLFMMRKSKMESAHEAFFGLEVHQRVKTLLIYMGENE